ncbi:hypothetical protein [Pseudomonas putida]|uniref:Uncharacterized protein n=1 Tax=Pseudomonas putida TaxID=303 RepID=A0A6I6XG11_PSEPU|nr:hypothetical protein [Pseudomonas putida]QHG64364.1 hypothetical protein C2H86_08025 [Pseudomonas putida]
MPKQAINLGTAPNGAGGDDRRSAWLKAKANFTELYNWLANTTQTDDQATALPTVLPLAKGGTGRNSLGSLISDLLGGGMYARSNVLGSVGQSGGVPTGGVLEYGNNANGKYLKFADGTLICYYYTASAYALSNIYGSCYVSSPLSFTFPHAFAANQGVPAVSPFAITPGAAIVWAATEGNAVNTSLQMRLVSPAQVSSYAGYIAIGRWY